MTSQIPPASTDWRVKDWLDKHTKLTALRDKIKNLDPDTRAIEDHQLDGYAIRKLACLDVEEKTIDSDPIFFKPLPIQSSGDFKQLVAQRYQNNVKWSRPCPGEDMMRVVFRTSLSQWSQARVVSGCPRPNFPMHSGGEDRLVHQTQICEWEFHRLPAHWGSRWPGPDEFQFEYDNSVAWVPNEERKDSTLIPRIAGAVVQYHKPDGTSLLRSELHSALNLIIHQIFDGLNEYHHLIPVLIYSFHQDTTAHITQFLFDGDELLVRQSCMLDLNSDERTDNVHLLLRWMMSFPVGETKLKPVPEAVETQTVNTGGEKEHGNIPVPSSLDRDISLGA